MGGLLFAKGMPSSRGARDNGRAVIAGNNDVGSDCNCAKSLSGFSKCRAQQQAVVARFAEISAEFASDTGVRVGLNGRIWYHPAAPYLPSSFRGDDELLRHTACGGVVSSLGRESRGRTTAVL